MVLGNAHLAKRPPIVLWACWWFIGILHFTRVNQAIETSAIVFELTHHTGHAFPDQFSLMGANGLIDLGDSSGVYQQSFVFPHDCMSVQIRCRGCHGPTPGFVRPPPKAIRRLTDNIGTSWIDVGEPIFKPLKCFIGLRRHRCTNTNHTDNEKDKWLQIVSWLSGTKVVGFHSFRSS